MKKTFNRVSAGGFILAFSFLTQSSFAQSAAQNQAAEQKVRIAANPAYDKAGKFKRIILGEHYRKEWATPVDIPVINLETEAGGLTAVKMGGGMQTKSLRLQGADGKEYVLRSVDKDPSKAIVAELRGTFADDIVQDQISSSNPYAPLVVAPLAQAAGILHSTPKLVYVERSPRLGEFENIFGGTLCLFEERPAGNEEDNAAYNHSKNIVNSEKLFEKVFSNSDHQVDERAFLKARLFDMLLGDWDRHEDQWVWASFKDNEKTFYQPIPRDRDQAFSSLGGVLPYLASRKWMLRKVQNFDYKIYDVNGLMMSGNHLDRNFTTRLTKNEWLAVANELENALTDQVIDSAFKMMPAAIYNVSGSATKAKLKIRRNHLDEYAKEYYEFLIEQVTITGTKAKEIFEVIRMSNDSTAVNVYKAGNKKEKNELFYHRVFLRSETNEIRLYGLDGNDVFNISGETDKGTLVRVIGGEGKDNFYDKSDVKGPGHYTKIYDNADNTFNTGDESRTFISNDTLKNDYKRKSFKYDWLAPVQRPGYNPDDGLYVGGGIVWKKQQYGKAPYSFMQSIGGNYSFKTSAYNFWYRGIFKEFIGKWDLNLEIDINAPNYSRNYFGLGNETEKDVDTKNYYRVRLNQVIAGSSLRREFGKKHSIDAGIGFQSVKVENTEDRFVSAETSKLDSADFGRKYYSTVHINYQFSTLNNPLYPTKGIKINSGIQFTQNIEEGNKNFVTVSAEIANYKTIGRFTLASHAGISANLSDDYEFFQANTLGSSTNLRGYSKDRFAGKTSVYQNTELRYRISTANAYIVKGTWGLLGFFDNGRVWMPEESSTTWHHGYGGGVWFLPFNKMALTATYGMSKEDNRLTIAAGFSF